MNEKLSNVLAELAQQLGTTVERLWPELVRYRVAMVVTDVVIGILLLGAVPLCFWFLKKAGDAEYNSEEAYIGGAILSGLASVFALIWTAIAISSVIPALVAPEAAAALWIISKLGGAK